MLRTIILAGAVGALLAGSAFAQDSIGIPINAKDPPTKEELERRKATERAYNEAVKKIPDKKSSGDPWGDIRPSATTAKHKQQ